MLGKTEGRRRGQHAVRRLGGSMDSMGTSVSKLWETVKDKEASSAAAHKVTKSRTRLRAEHVNKAVTNLHWGLPWGLGAKESAGQ